MKCQVTNIYHPANPNGIQQDHCSYSFQMQYNHLTLIRKRNPSLALIPFEQNKNNSQPQRGSSLIAQHQMPGNEHISSGEPQRGSTGRPFLTHFRTDTINSYLFDMQPLPCITPITSTQSEQILLFKLNPVLIQQADIFFFECNSLMMLFLIIYVFN